MPTYSYLPGTQISTIDGGLTSKRVPTTALTLIVGTAGDGPANEPYQVTSRATAASIFGLSGSLVRAMEEVASGGNDNIVLFRMGTSPAALNGVGAVSGTTTSVSNPSPTASTTTSGSVATFALVSSSSTLSGSLHVAVGGGGAIIKTFTAGTTIGQAVTQLNGTSAFSTAGLVASQGSGGSANDLIITGPDDISVNGTNTLSVSGTSLSQVNPPSEPGFNITFSEIAANTTSRYYIWYNTGVLYVWLDGQLVYANDVTNGNVIDASNITISGTINGNTGLAIGSGSAPPTLAQAISISAAAALSTSGANTAPVLIAPVVGTALTGRQTYIAIAKALDLLAMYPVDQVFCPDAIIDQPNVAYYVSGTPATAINNPATNANALDWLKIVGDGEGNNVYQWASETMDSNGATVTAMTASTVAQRHTAGFFETNYVNLLGNYCYEQETVGLNGTCIAFIGASAPASYGLSDTRNWIGYLPTYDLVNTSEVDVSGKGLLGLPIVAGAASTSLNNLCADYAGGTRLPGVFQTNNNLYDGTVQFDSNNNPVDIGAYVHCMADYAIVSNGYLTNYVTNLAGVVAGYHSTLDQKVALTNKALSVIQIWKANNAQMDSLTKIGINVLRYKGNNALPALLHGDTLANPKSDYINLLRQNIKGLIVQTTRQVADGFIGFASTDLLSLSALQTALSKKFLTLQQRGYITAYNFTVLTTNADVRLGHASIAITFTPVNELVQLDVQVGISQ